MDEQRLQALEAEVARLRAEARRQRRVRWALGLAGLGLVLAGARLAPSVVRAERFELTDRDGEIRGVLATDVDGPYLELVDEDGGRAMLQVRDGEGSLVLDDTDGPVAEPLAEVEPPVEETPPVEPAEAEYRVAPSRVVLTAPDYGVRGIMLSCHSSGVRYVAPVDEEGVAWFPEVPFDDRCIASLRGGAPPLRFEVEPLQELHCNPLTTTLMMRCESQPLPEAE